MPFKWLKQKMIGNREAIVDIETLARFLSFEVAKISGNLVMKYAQKRLGKIHYRLSKDENYCQELIACQIKLHAKILSDITIIIARLFQIDDMTRAVKFKTMILNIHQAYVETAPKKFALTGQLTPECLSKKQQALSMLANKTGEDLFHLLPMTDNLLVSNVAIFQGQVRLAYADLLSKFSKRYKKEALAQALCIQSSKQGE